MGIVTKTWSGSEALTAADLNQNFTDIEDYIQALTNSDLSQDAGITSDKLLDRYGPFFITKNLVPHGGAGADFTTEFTMPAQTAQGSATEIGAISVPVPSGKRAYLCSVAFHARLAGTGAPRLWITHAGSVLGGSGGADLSAGTWNYLRNSSPFAAPLLALSHDDEIKFYLGYDGTASTSGLGIDVVLGLKYELTS